MNRIKYFLALGLLICLFSFSKKQDGKIAEEYSLKAACILNFINFIEWDGSNIDGDFIIGVVASSPITQSLEDIAKTKTVGNKKISIRYFDSPDEIGDCQILFIPANNSFSLNEILSKVNHKNILTISEQDGYSQQGTAINFFIVNNKIKFEVNVNSLNAQGLKASSQLLKLAKIVG
jgi:hypothetical protein